MTDLITVDKQVEELQKAMLLSPNNVGKLFPVHHSFAPGVYMREIAMPAGAIVIGERHKTKHFNLITEGECLVKMGDTISYLKAPKRFVSEAGVKKIVYCITTVKWTTIHPTEETDLDKLREQIIDTKYEANLLSQVKELA